MVIKNKNKMTVLELKNIIKELSDDMVVGNTGHYGEFLSAWDARVVKTYKFSDVNNKFNILSIGIESPGPNPE
jgi:hypothetical protein